MALRSMRENDFDAVITEIGLENGELGLELAREAKELAHPPAVMIYTGDPTVERLRRALHVGVDYVAFKPGDLQEIKSALFRLISRRAKAVPA
jgi:DNA-binding NarL/FixJ family response regulator